MKERKELTTKNKLGFWIMMGSLTAMIISTIMMQSPEYIPVCLIPLFAGGILYE